MKSLLLWMILASALMAQDANAPLTSIISTDGTTSLKSKGQEVKLYGTASTFIGTTTLAVPVWAPETTVRAEIRDGGDFILHSADGRELLRLKRDKRGDEIHEALAALLVSIGWRSTVKDWRELTPKQEVAAKK